MSEARMVEVRRKVLKENDVRARKLRDQFHAAGTKVISLVSSPGSGKTTLLERLLKDLGQTYRVAALVGDLATENDAARLARSGAQVKQITTGTVCHLDAGMVEKALDSWKIEDIDFLFIENVGNLVCPSSFDLGEDLRLVLVSTTEGEDKPLKYPTIFNTADVAVVTKLDLAVAAGVDLQELTTNISCVRPGIQILNVSTKSGEGMQELKELLARSREDRATIARAPELCLPDMKSAD
jgi:hydrogenase nickel incorporation protein HypB